MNSKKFSKWVAGLHYATWRGKADKFSYDTSANVTFWFPRWTNSDDKKLAKCKNVLKKISRADVKYGWAWDPETVLVVVDWDFAKSLDLDPWLNTGDHPLTAKDLGAYFDDFVGPMN